MVMVKLFLFLGKLWMLSSYSSSWLSDGSGVGLNRESSSIIGKNGYRFRYIFLISVQSARENVAELSVFNHYFYLYRYQFDIQAYKIICTRLIFSVWVSFGCSQVIYHHG